MEFQSSLPHLPAGSLTGKHGVDGLTGAGAKAHNRDFDDTSSVKSGSVISMASSSKAVLCRVCKDPEELPSKPFVKCSHCRQVWHQHCHKNPDLDCSKPIPLNFICARCVLKSHSTEAPSSRKRSVDGTLKIGNEKGSVEKVSTAGDLPPQPTNDSTAKPDTMRTSQSVPSEPPLQMKPGMAQSVLPTPTCTYPGCGLPIFSSISGATIHGTNIVCPKHKAAQRFAKAKAQPLPSAALPPPKPFQKNKLYKPRPDDMQFLKKRPSISKRNSASDETSKRNPGVSKPVNIQMQPAVTSSGRDQLPKTVALPKGSPTELSANRIPSQSSVYNTTSSSSNLGLASPRVASPSPEYEPAPPRIPDIDNIWGNEDGDVDSPGSQIASELRANAEEFRDPDRLSTPSPVREQSSERHTYNSSTAKTEIPKFTVDVEEDDDFLGHDALIGQLASEHVPSPDRNRAVRNVFSADALPVPNLPLDPGANPDVDMTGTGDQNAQPQAVEEDMNEGWSIEGGPETCLQRRLARGEFDESVLDSYLEKQRDRPLIYDPRPDLPAQVWGAIDPRKAWPERPMSDEERAAKIRQIQARGGRKANWGKMFTAQNLQEKEEHGWDTHQWQKRRDDDETKELVRRLEELFQVENLANMVPATRNGKLVMIERESETLDGETRGPGRRKKKAEAKVYPVHGAPLTN